MKLKSRVSATRVRKPFQKNCLSANLLRKGLIENPQQCLDLRTLSSNPIGVINRRNGFDKPAQPLPLKRAEL